MTEIDRRIMALGYEIRVSDLSCCYIVYENKKQDQEIIIEWDDESIEYCRIFFTNNNTDKRLAWTYNSNTPGVNHSRGRDIRC